MAAKTVLNYLPRESVIHKLTGTTKLAFFLLFTFASMITYNTWVLLEEELADSSGLSHGSVAIGASETALNIFLLDKLKSFHMTYPGIRLKLYNHSTPEARNFPFGR